MNNLNWRRAFIFQTTTRWKSELGHDLGPWATRLSRNWAIPGPAESDICVAPARCVVFFSPYGGKQGAS